MEEWQLRVIEEKKQLDARIVALIDYIGASSSLPDDERNRLSRQYTAMDEYSVVLGERIEAFKV